MNPLFIGLMSGTSLDGIDAALVQFDDASRDKPVSVLAIHYQPYPPDFRTRLGALCFADTIRLPELGALDTVLAGLFAEAANTLIESSGIDRRSILAIGSHGQTVYHHPTGATPFTLQIGDPNRIAQLTGITTIADFRRRDVAAGGQGAPLTPGFHHACLRSNEENRVVVNIGGIANLTCLPRDPEAHVLGFDPGPGNTLMDVWISKHLGLALDKDGQWAASGRVSEALVREWLDDPYFARSAPKSTGQEYFSEQWLTRHLQQHDLPPEDVQASLLELTARSITDAIQRYQPDSERVLLCGGGYRNTALVRRIQERLDCPLDSTGVCGVDPDWVEAAAFAWLARQTYTGQPGNLPAVTGAGCPVILGGIYRA